MSKQLTKSPTRYTVWANGKTRTGTAGNILTFVRNAAREDSLIHRLSVEDYADALIENATYHFPDGMVPELLTSRHFPSRFDEALEYLSLMPASGVRILARKDD